MTGESYFDYATVGYEASSGEILWSARYSGRPEPWYMDRATWTVPVFPR